MARFGVRHLMVASAVVSVLACTPVAAHSVATIPGVSMLVHVSPDDRPITGQPVKLHALVTAKAEKFNPDKCDCRVILSMKGEQVADLPASITERTPKTVTFGAPYTFARSGEYELKFVAKPKSASFAQFELSEELIVRSGEKLPGWAWAIGILGTLAAIGIGYAGLRSRRHRSPAHHRAKYREDLHND